MSYMKWALNRRINGLHCKSEQGPSSSIFDVVIKTGFHVLREEGKSLLLFFLAPCGIVLGIFVSLLFFFWR